VAITVLLPARLVVLGCTRLAVRRGRLRRRIVIVGATDLAHELLTRLNKQGHTEPSVVAGIFDSRDETRRPSEIAGVPVRGDIGALCELGAKERIDLVIVALPFNRAIDTLELLRQVHDLAGEVVVLLDDSRQTPRVFSRISVAGMPALKLIRPPLMPVALIAKQVTDLSVAMLALAITWPILLGACIAIRLESRGPVFFRQERLGLHGRKFHIVKLRTMRSDSSDKGNQGALQIAHRVTRVGALLRASCIDELPQLLNVLLGHMSMVGPRPHVAGMLVAGVPIAELAPGYAVRHRMKPGLTGWAQVNSLSGTITDCAMAREVTEHDLAYITEWSLWLDVRILARTAAVAVFGRTAFESKTYEWRDL
jgi:putative colanic acid biosynthesis UDP-glucose lipid carrier transferase